MGRTFGRLTKTNEQLVSENRRKQYERMKWAEIVIWQRSMFYLNISAALGLLTGLALTVMLLTKIDFGETIICMAICVPVFYAVIKLSVERICHDTKIGNQAGLLFGVACSIGAVIAIVLAHIKFINV